MGVRRGEVGDEGVLRDLRLRALADAPEAFSASYEANAARTTADWRRWLGSVATFFFEAENGRAVGLVGMAAAEDEPDVRDLISMWVDPSVRGQGVGDALVQAVLRAAADSGGRIGRVTVYESNPAARRLYERHGYRRNGRSWPPDELGRVAIELTVELVPAGPPTA